MPYLVRAKGRTVRVMDLGRGVMVEIGHDPVPMLDLPPAALRIPGGDRDLEVVHVGSLDGYETPQSIVAPATVEVKAVEPRVRKKHRRD
jgi:hypothetical protein